MNVYQSVKRWLLLTFARELAVASDINETVDLPIKMALSHFLPIKPGTSKAELIPLLDDAILRQDIAPVEGVDLVISSNAWPTIERFFIEDDALTATLFELGCDCYGIKTVYTRVKNHIQNHYGQNLSVTPQQVSPYPTLLWETNGLACYLQVLNEKVININPLFWPRDIFGSDPNGTFIFKAGGKFTVMPTIAIIIAKDMKTIARVFGYLQKDLAARGTCVTLLNLPCIMKM
ncbi:hypothetical protein ACFL6P_09735 [Candidatus Latescibacterota bacterium]